MVGHGRPLGSILLGRGWITQEQLGSCLEEQCIDALARVIAADRGVFLYSAGVVPPQRAELVPLNGDRILIEAMRRTDELITLRRLLPAPTAPLALGPVVDEVADTLGDAEVLVAATLVSGAATLAALTDRVAMDELLLWRTVISMRERGLLLVGDATVAPDPDLVGLLGPDGAWFGLPHPDDPPLDDPFLS